ncbi:TonB-dependent receptor [Aliidongia dinghuensis]|uniref:TonB-dependent receptor n=1 Tax=Aliidongia dinghuensis TaxID=1867774 RepID=A0A8J2YUQ2_9PROT|nr:TonB-dependent receptor [Aliidongia dinghuensis]GGF20570.1 TonB-dependent receptor [Aliidongia dinghuensis]
MNQSKLLTFLLASTALISSGALAQQAAPQQVTPQQATNVGKVTVDTPAEDAPGNGYIIQEDGGKERSTVTKEAIERHPASANIFQLLDRTPGVNAQSTDGTGLFGGQLSVRGFNSDEIGFTIAGVPVNDSGNYAVFPQEYVDAENLEEISITQGAPDPDQPQGGAVGGAVSVVPQEPTEYRRVRIVQSIGQNNFFKSFGRIDTGDLFNTTFRMFLSYSKAETDKWKGPGNADRDHLDFGAVYETPGGSKFSAYSFFNSAVNNSFLNPTLAQFQTFGRNFDFEPNFTPFAPPVKGTVQNQAANQTGTGGTQKLTSAYPNLAYNYGNYYKYRVNPFNNEIASFTADLKLLDNLRASVEPYYWNGYGNGGGTSSLTEGSATNAYAGFGSSRPAAFVGTAPFTTPDLNGDGDKLDTILYYRPSITSTQRPGVNTKFTYEALDWDTVRFGLNYDHSRHHQTQPFESIGPTGEIDVWANQNDLLLHRPDGTLVQGRDQLTFNDTKIAYLENTSTFLNDRAKVVLGIKRQETNRDGNNRLPFALATGLPNVIHPSVDYLNYLPSIQTSFKITEENQVFANLQKNARAPSNYTLYENAYNTVGNQIQETAWNLDVGYRFQNPYVLASISAFAVNFQNRQLNIALPDDPTSFTDINAGTVHNRGVELEIGTAKPIYDVNLYASASYTKSLIKSDLLTSIAASGGKPGILDFAIPTSGKVYPNTPKWQISGVASYSPPFFPGAYIGLSPKWTSSREATLVNDEKIPGYMKVDLFAGYAVPDDMVKVVNNVKIQFNVDNLFDRDYLFFGYGASSGAINAHAVTTRQGTIGASGTPTYTVGSPLFFSIKVSADF